MSGYRAEIATIGFTAVVITGLLLGHDGMLLTLAASALAGAAGLFFGKQPGAGAKPQGVTA